MAASRGLQVHNLWKRFRLRREPKGGFRRRLGEQAEEIWALKGLNFQVPAGGALGVIGANGSGKTTLLQIVAGVMRATQGEVHTPDRVVAILNPTAGFHPDLTGRANIRMLGTLHGFGRKALDAKTEAIVDFAGLDAYIDQPLRTYSAGMMIRLGFSTVSHLEPELLIVDEVLSAGDLAFQRRSAGRARDLRAQGTTLLVSTHALGDLATLCDRLLLLENGEVRAEGSADEVVASYLQRVEAQGGRIEKGAAAVAGLRPTSPSHSIHITEVRVNGQLAGDAIEVQAGEPLTLEVDYACEEAVDDAVFRLQFFRNDGLFVHGNNTVRAGLDLGTLDGKGTARLHYESFGLLAGDYYLSAGIWPDEYRSYTTGEAYDHQPSAGIVRVLAPRSLGGGVAGFPSKWSVERRPAPAVTAPRTASGGTTEGGAG